MDINLYYTLKGNDITKTFLINLFNKNNKESVDETTPIELDIKLLKENNSELLNFKDLKDFKETTFKTTIGSLIFNLCVYNFKSKDDSNINIKDLVTYKNFELNKSNIGKLYNELTDLILYDLIDTTALNNFIDRLNWIGFTLVPILNPSLDLDTIQASPEVQKFKEDLFTANQDILDNNDVIRFNNEIEPKILKKAEEDLDNRKASGKMIYDSGVNGSFSNNYKLTALMRGPVSKSDDNTSFVIGRSSLTDGVSKDEMYIANDINVQGSIGRAIATRKGGYIVKQMSAAFSSITLDNEKSDCKTTRTLKISLDPSNFSEYEFRYIVDKGELVELNKFNKDKYIGKDINIRTPFYCQNAKICNICAGNKLYKLNIKNVGITLSNIGSSLLNASLKAFHTLAVNSSKYDITKFMTKL